MATYRPLWEALHKTGMAHSEVRRVVYYFTRRLNADMKDVVGNKVLYQWEQDMEAFLKDKEDPGAPKTRSRNKSRGSKPDRVPPRRTVGQVDGPSRRKRPRR